MRIDSHQHFWLYDAKEYAWIPKNSPLAQDHLPPELARKQAPLGLSGSVAVQARQSLEESRWLLELAEHYSTVKGVVGWVDLRSEEAEEQLGRFAKHPKFAGVRHVVQDEPDDNFMLREDFQRGSSKLKQFKLTYDILIYPKQLPAAIRLVRKFPEQKFVLDHIAKPFIRDGTLSPWKEQIRELALASNVWCKVSGMVTEAKRHAWKREDFRPYLDVVLAAFGTDKLMFGSDWPVCLLSGSYEEVFGIVENYVHGFPAAVREKVLGGNCAEFYGLETQTQKSAAGSTLKKD